MSSSVLFLSKNGWEWVAFLEKWVGVGCFSWKMGGSGSFLSKNGWQWVVFLEKWVGVGESGWEWLGTQFGKALSVLVRNSKASLTSLDWQEHEDSASDNSPFVIGDNGSSNDIIRMKKQRLDNATNTIIGHLNINSFRNKFAFVEDVIKLFDVFLVSESKLHHNITRSFFKKKYDKVTLIGDFNLSSDMFLLKYFCKHIT